MSKRKFSEFPSFQGKEMVGMSKFETYQKINKKEYTVLINGQPVKTPEFTTKSTSSYRLSPDFMLYKKCAKCLNWYPVAQYILEKKEWKKIWKAEEYRKLESGFPSYCTTCYNEILQAKRRNKKEGNPNSNKFNRKKDTVMWQENVYQYLMLRSILEKKSKNQLLNEIILKEMEQKKISIKMN